MRSVHVLMVPLQALNKNVAAGFVTTNPTVKLTFPTDNSTASQLARLNAAAVTLQNLEGPGVGCPISSTTFSAQHKAIAAETLNTTFSTTSPTTSPTSSPSASASNTGSCSVTPSVPATTPAQTSSPTSPSPSSVANTTSGTSSSINTILPTDAQIAALAPPLGWQSGINPDGAYVCYLSRSPNSRGILKVPGTVMEP